MKLWGGRFETGPSGGRMLETAQTLQRLNPFTEPELDAPCGLSFQCLVQQRLNVGLVGQALGCGKLLRLSQVHGA